jgi:glutamate/tyrosine decarboxylase-like PLP-dependent enzyme
MVDAPLDRALRHAEAFLSSLPERAVGPPADPDVLRAALGRELTDDGVAPEQVIDELVAAADPGIVATAGPRYFGFVTGGALPAALAADWLAAAWDQNAHAWIGSPAAAVVEEVVADWVLSLLGLPQDAGVGLVTGCQMANVTCLAVARDSVLKRAGWDVAAQGLIGAPPLTVIAGQEAHATIFSALRMIGLGRDSAHLVAADDQGRMDPDALARGLRDAGPAIVCAQAGNVNSGAFDPLEPIEYLCEQSGAWLHVDGAFGLWAAASPALRHLTRGLERADSWATDAHKWLNVPYDSGLAIVRDAAAHRHAMSLSAAYLVAGEQRDNYDFTPEASRRARGFAIYAALRSLGRRGLAELIERNCAQARRFAEILREGGAEILNDVVLNQVLVAAPPEAVARVQADGTCWVGGSNWHGRDVIRISCSSWATTDADVERSARAILAALSAR